MPHSAQSAIRIYRYHPAIFASVFTQRQTGIRSAVDVATHGKRKIQSTIHFHQKETSQPYDPYLTRGKGRYILTDTAHCN